MLEELAAIVTILLGIPALTKWGRNQYKKLWHFLTRYRPKVPNEIVRFVPQDHHCWWSLGKIGNKPAMQVVCDWYITNISNFDALICSVSLRKPKVVGHIMVQHSEKNYYGNYAIPPGFTTKARADFCIQPPICEEDEPLIVDVDFVDQLGNAYQVRKLKLHPHPNKNEKVIDVPTERISDLNNPIEKEVATVLQAEISRYKNCGRRVGGLGSVTTIYRGNSYDGVGSECRTPDSPKLQSIVHDPENASISSDNALTLINFYSSLEEKQQANFVESLLKRLSRKTAYAQVGYFILLVFYRIGHLKKALEGAKNNLQNDDEYGFSNFLMLLDGLLKYEYQKFSIEMLDDIERFLEGIKEHTFNIPERLSAIRTILLEKRINKDNK